MSKLLKINPSATSARVVLKIDRWGLLEAKREIEGTFPGHPGLKNLEHVSGSFDYQMIWDGKNWIPIERPKNVSEIAESKQQIREFKTRVRRSDRQFRHEEE